VRASLYYLDQLGERRYRARRLEIERRLAKLLEDPYTAAGAERLRYQFAGLRSARVFEATRFIYRLCEECRQLQEGATNSLDCCVNGATADRTLNLLCLSEHYDDVPAEFDFDG
jgi:Txe/YoeB family toxin of Txe-Axe toxin-antitoxin module